MLIEYTQNHIIVPQKSVDLVNIEVDVVAKYATAAAVDTSSTAGTEITKPIDSWIVSTLLNRIELLESKVV